VALCLRSPLLGGLGFRNGFSLRRGGVSVGPHASLNLGRSVGDDPLAVSENHRRLALELGYRPEALCEVDQVHGARVERVQAGHEAAAYRTRAADALVSDLAGSVLGIRVADCAAVLLADPASGAVAAAHAGWRGVVAGVVPAAVRALCELHDSAPLQLVAAIFPSIGPQAFEVGEDVAQQVVAAAGSTEVVRVGTGKPHVDLQRAVLEQLAAAGVARNNVDLVIGCTFSEPTAFFSYRRDAGVTGRHLAVIMPRC
jgi:polyphenol oxidase